MPFAFSNLLAMTPLLCPTGTLPPGGTTVMYVPTSCLGQQDKMIQLSLVRTQDSPTGKLSVIGNGTRLPAMEIQRPYYPTSERRKEAVHVCFQCLLGSFYMFLKMIFLREVGFKKNSKPFY